MPMDSPTYTEQINYHRRETSAVHVGDTPLGGKNPIRIQSMSDVATTDTHKAIDQAIQLNLAGAEYFRFTAQGVVQAKALDAIREGLLQRGFRIPLIADIHFNPQAAFEALKHVEKVRINPGNFADTKRLASESDSDYEARSKALIEEKFRDFLLRASSWGRAIRIGTNHGSLSQRILQKWGNTPRGMVESTLEYLTICHDVGFSEVVVSMKSSNILVMTEAVRMLVCRLKSAFSPIPLHLGVTEAGDSEDGRIKSAVGIGSLLADGIGDTIRVSLSEPPVAEIPVAQAILRHIATRAESPRIEEVPETPYHRGILSRSSAYPIPGKFGQGLPFPVFIQGKGSNETIPNVESNDLLLTDSEEIDTIFSKKTENGKGILLKFFCEELSPACIEAIRSQAPEAAILLMARHPNRIGHWRNAIAKLASAGVKAPIVLGFQSEESDFDRLLIEASVDLGTLLLDGVGSGICLSCPHHSQKSLHKLALGILQAARLRFSHTEFISCPGCGRTLFDLQGTVGKVKSALGHLKNLKIGVMGCIVNGPGEMADADYGYVGGAPGKIDLYKGQTLRKRGIPQEKAVESLIELIREEGDWQEP